MMSQLMEELNYKITEKQVKDGVFYPHGTGCSKHSDCLTCPLEPEECNYDYDRRYGKNESQDTPKI